MTALGTVEFGAAWKRTSEKGQDFLSVSIDDPALSGALNAALFPGESSETAVLVWNRKRPEKAETPAESGAEKPSKVAKAKAK